MKNFLRGLVCGAILMWAADAFVVDAQVEEPIVFHVPPIAKDTTWTPAQREDLRRQWQDFVTQCNTNTRSITGRMRQID